MKRIAKDFLQFVQEQGVVGVAVAFVMGAAITKLVTAFVTAFINPILSVLVGSAGNLASAHFSIGDANFYYGLFISALIDFLVVAFVIYVFFKLFRLEKLDKKKAEGKEKK